MVKGVTERAQDKLHKSWNSNGQKAAVGLTVLAVESEVGLADIPYCVGVGRDIEF